MSALVGYFDGTACIPFDATTLKLNQKVMITGLDEFMENKKTPTIDFAKYRGGGKLWGDDIDEHLKELRSDRM